MTRKVRPRATLASGWATGGWRRLGILALILAATAMVSRAQDSPVFTTLVNFDGTNGANPGDAFGFLAALVQGTDGNLYGTTSGGGANSQGTVFKMTPTGTLTALYSFCAQINCTDGSLPNGLMLATDGNFYGTTFYGGANGGGTVFKITPSGTLTTLYSFCAQTNCTDGISPYAGLVQAADGNFYGTTGFGGASTAACSAGCGTVFKITPEGALTTLHGFDFTDGDAPAAPLIQGTDGNLYGTTVAGGANNSCFFGCGTLFEITPGGILTTLHSFDGTDGSFLGAALVQGTNGNFYGTAFGGANSNGTIFRITRAGTFTTLYNFCSQTNCADGGFPGPLVQATDGNLYGGTGFLGTSSACVGGCGTLFKMTPEGALATLLSFDYTDGAGPKGLVQATNGTFYGAAASGGTSNACSGGCGTVFSLAVGLGPFVETVPVAAKLGALVTILGTDLTGASSVRFNGKEAAFSVVSPTEIAATVPADGKAGFVTVHTPSGTLKSNVKFQVLP
jgi:uncharacterized repeat protein (TIGR03803 family)